MPENDAELEFIETQVSVRYAETDKMGIAYYANYLVWFEVGRVAWCKAKGFRYAEMESKDNRYLMALRVFSDFSRDFPFGRRSDTLRATTPSH